MIPKTYSETGGARYGSSFWTAVNFTWPFATLTATSEQIEIRVSLGKLWSKTFALERALIKSIRRKRSLWSVGIEVDHSVSEVPPFILFWTFRYRRLKQELESLGYEICEVKGSH